MEFYQSRFGKLVGTSYGEVLPVAREIYRGITRRTKRTPYARSAFFDGEKVFLNVFWKHLSEKNRRDKLRRLRYYECAIDVIRHSRNKPHIKINREGRGEKLYRFYGYTRKKEKFAVQLKEDGRGGKHFISIIELK